MSKLSALDSEQLNAIKELLDSEPTSMEKVDAVMHYLHEQRADYHWVGVYKLAGDTLVLGPYRGPQTDHVRIPVGRGVCGTAVAENANQIVDDVTATSNYLACNLETKSEIVVLIRDEQDTNAGLGSDGRILGQIDVDGTKVRQFGPADEAFLSQVAVLLAPFVPDL